MKNSSPEERLRVVSEFEIWIWNNIANDFISKNDILSLNEKKLVCFCAPQKCHGHILKEIVELLVNNETKFDNKKRQLQSSKTLKP